MATNLAKAISHLQNDPVLSRLIRQIELPAPSPNLPLYNALLRSIVSQQLSVKAAATIHGRFLELFPEQNPQPEQLMAMPLEALRSAGLSRQKGSYLQNVAGFFSEHPMENAYWEAMENEALIEKLTEIKGVGKWTVQMILMFTLDRPDVFPVDDLGIRQAMVDLYEVREDGRALPARLETIAEPWRPFRTIACRYLWRYKDIKPIIG